MPPNKILAVGRSAVLVVASPRQRIWPPPPTVTNKGNRGFFFRSVSHNNLETCGLATLGHLVVVNEEQSVCASVGHVAGAVGAQSLKQVANLFIVGSMPMSTIMALLSSGHSATLPTSGLTAVPLL